jgi:GDP-4-dehydro-6-deoxy-D-mannose reductase
MQGGRILLTGATGFVGGHVARQARPQGLTVVPLEGDLRDPETARNAVEAAAPDAVVHLASRKPSASSDSWALLADEVAMAGNLFRALHDAVPAAALLIAGSAAQYGAGSPAPLSETVPLRPVSAYGAVKTVLEGAFTAEKLRGGTRVIWARSFNCLGPGQQPNTPAADWARQVASAEAAGGGVVRTGHLDVVRDFLDVRDVADAYLALIASDFAGVVNVGSGRATRLEELAGLFAQRAQVPLELELDPALERAGDPPHVVANVDLLHSVTTWRPAWTLEQSVEEMLGEARRALADAPAPTAGGR